MIKRIFLLLAAISLCSCASMKEYAPKTTVYTNNPFFYNNSIAIQNAAGPNIVILPQSRGEGFVAEYRYGKRSWRTLWLRERIPTKLISLSYGQSVTLPLYQNLTPYVVNVPIALKVIERGGVVGFYNECYAIYPNQNGHVVLNFGPRELRLLKTGNSGRVCGGNYW